MIRAIAIDDEPIALDVIRLHAIKIPFLDLKATFVSTTEALKYLQVNEVDLVFLDIRMPDLTGIELATLLPKTLHVIFTTAYAEYAVKGFDLAAADYLLKPINLSRLLQGCILVKERMLKDSAAKKQEAHLFVKEGYDLVKIDLNQITYIEAGDNYLSIYQGHKRTLTRMTLTEISNRLSPDAFQRIHKSYIIALKFIEKIERSQLIVDGVKVPLSAAYKDDLLFKLKQ
ncbi:MAG: LytTR family DNA-binding domain-containing protein [Mucilaginibacter sp.]|uniref:LytR/AlgR family response regulator transcription factor n=1 Tax=Mucilaginibacter sp. TaxID=1882438 RepID=UPI0031A720BE